jgi:hypothetical protein
MRFEEHENGWELGFKQGRVAYIHIDFRLALDLTDDSGTANVVVESPCRLLHATGETLLTPSEPTSLAPILALFDAAVTAVTIGRSGKLTVCFGDQSCIRVDPDGRYEAWQVGCPPLGLLLVCQAGGEVSVFRAQKVSGPFFKKGS